MLARFLRRSLPLLARRYFPPRWSAGTGCKVAQPVIELFERRAAAELAIGALAGQSVRRDQISVVRRDWTELGDSPHGAGAGLGGLGILLAGGAQRTIPEVGTVLVVGPLVAIMGSPWRLPSGAAGGELRGALLQVGCTTGEAGAYIDGVRRGGTLVAVHDAAWAVEVRAVMRRAAAAGVWAGRTGPVATRA